MAKEAKEQQQKQVSQVGVKSKLEQPKEALVGSTSSKEPRMAVLAQAGKEITQEKQESLEERQLRLQQRRD